VLVLKTPTKPYSEEEVDAVERFARGGGGVFLIGDHTNVFGTSTFLNSIARRAGFVFRYDSLLDIENEFIVVERPSRRLRHPILKNVDEFFFQTSCSIQSLSFPWASAAMVGTTLKAQPADYRQDNFFPQVENSAEIEYGIFNRLVAASWGEGRIVAFSDSTVFSNFAAFLPGRRELFMDAIQWLNHKGLGDGFRTPLGIGGLLCGFALFISVALGSDIWRAGLLLMLMAVVFTAGMIALNSASVASFTSMEPRRAPSMVTFDASVSDWELPIRNYTQKPERSIQLLSQWTLRLGFFYRVSDDLRESTSHSQVLALGAVGRPLDERRLDMLEGFVRGGGRLLLFGRRGPDSANLRELASRFGIQVSEDASTGTTVSPIGGSSSWKVDRFPPLSGGTPILATENGEVALLRKNLGSGAVYVCTLLDEFFDDKMGKTDSTVPDSRLKHHFDLVYGVFEGVVRGDEIAALEKYGSREYEDPDEADPDEDR
jgi:hypothetical protein